MAAPMHCRRDLKGMAIIPPRRVAAHNLVDFQRIFAPMQVKNWTAAEFGQDLKAILLSPLAQIAQASG
jgi:hypothetical protein